MTIGFVTRASDGAVVSVLSQTKTRIYTNTMPGAPSATQRGTTNGICAILDACLVSGLTTVKTLNVNAMTRVGTTVTVSQAAHGYMDYCVILISGASDPAYNGVHRIVVADANTYSFQLDAALTPASPAVGTITTQVPSAGWSKPFAGTNKGVYRPADGPRHFLRIDDSALANMSKVRAYRSMTDVDTGTGMYPGLGKAPDGSCNWTKPNGGLSWKVVADDKGVHIIVDSGVWGVMAYYFGWYKDLYSYDPDGASLICVNSFNTALTSGQAAGASSEVPALAWQVAVPQSIDINAQITNCCGYLAKSYDGVYDDTGVPYGMLGYAVKMNNSSFQSLMNNQHNDTYAAVVNIGNTGGSGTPAGLRGYIFQTPYLLEVSYASQQLIPRGTAPWLQCLSLYAAQTYDNTVFRAVERFGAVVSYATGFDSWGNSNSIRAQLIPLGNWEDVL